MKRSLTYTFILVFCCLIHAKVSIAQQMVLLPFANGFSSVVDIKHAGDDRIFVVEKAGRIKIVSQTGTTNPVLYLNIVSKVGSGGNEQGLLGLAFSPNYATDGRFYVNYTNTSGSTVIARYNVSLGNPDVADATSELILLTIAQPFTNHNGGEIAFGHDGYLYIGTGDGGSGGDPGNRAQNPLQWLGKMLRIDVSGIGAYTVPASNPFVGNASYLPEIWALGLRNPWRYSFDKITGDLWIADVGQNVKEEIDMQPASSTGGENYGWRCYEGFSTYNTSGCGGISNYVFPVYDYNHSGANSGCSITGGHVYRGAKYPSMFGRYFYADYCSGLIGSLSGGCNPAYVHTSHGVYSAFQYSTFGEDKYGELYLASIGSGIIQKMADTTGCIPIAFISCADTLFSCDTTYLLSTPEGLGFSYQWYMNAAPVAGGNAHTLLANSGGSYYVEVYSPSFCSKVSDPVEIVFYPTTVVSFSGLNPNYCLDDPIASLVGVPANGIFSGSGVSASSFFPPQAGAGVHPISYAYTDGNGCTNIAQQPTEVFALPVMPTISQNMNVLTSSYTSGNQWYDSSGVIPGATANNYLPSQSGIYSVVYTDANGCTSTSAPFNFIFTSTLFIDAAEFIFIFPNPASDFILIKNKGQQNLKNIVWYNQLGEVVLKLDQTVERGAELKVEVSTLLPGVYFMQGNVNEQVFRKKLVLIHN